MSQAAGHNLDLHSAHRLVSLDAFRGFTIAAMLLVNNPGSWSHLYSQLAHAKWHGWTFTDWIFPFFLFISGISMALSFARLRAQGTERPVLWRKASVRAGVVFLIGLGLNLFPMFNVDTVRIPGVLQRIALCTLVAAPLLLYFDCRRQCLWILALWAVYTVLMLWVPVPDSTGVLRAGVLEPGQDFGAHIDRLFLTGHMWVSSKTWDPEGLVSTLPAVCSLLLGALTGQWLGRATEHRQRLDPMQTKASQTVWMLLAGLACLWLGAMLDVLLMPINKSLWTVSYCIFMNGWALLVFGIFFWLLDACDTANLRAACATLFKPFVVYGMNALFIFALSGIIAKLFNFIQIAQADGKTQSLKAVLYAPLQSLPIAPVNASLLYALGFNALMLTIAWAMWHMRWFVKV